MAERTVCYMKQFNFRDLFDEYNGNKSYKHTYTIDPKDELFSSLYIPIGTKPYELKDVVTFGFTNKTEQLFENETDYSSFIEFINPQVKLGMQRGIEPLQVKIAVPIRYDEDGKMVYFPVPPPW